MAVAASKTANRHSQKSLVSRAAERPPASKPGGSAFWHERFHCAKGKWKTIDLLRETPISVKYSPPPFDITAAAATYCVGQMNWEFA